MLSILAAVAWASQAASEPATASQPGARYGAALAFDHFTRRVILFGGSDPRASPVPRYGDTWAWNGEQWTSLSRTGPSARANAAMACDPGARRVLLFGGFNGQQLLDELWQWNGRGWTRIASAHSPGARGHSAMAFDEARRQLVLFGGATGDPTGSRVAHGDTWAWSGKDWQQVSAAGPSPRFGHAMTYDAARRRVVLFGGRDKDDRPLGDTWVWNGARWQELTTNGPPPRLLHALAFDENRRAVILFGGWDATPSSSAAEYLADTWELKDVQWRPLRVSGPPGLRGHSMASDVRRKRIVLFGGGTPTATLGETWEWDAASWRWRAGATR